MAAASRSARNDPFLVVLTIVWYTRLGKAT